MSQLQLSILIPTYNRAKYLEHLLNFIKDEIYNLDCSYEILLSNNASTDNTQSLINKYQEDMKLTCFNQDENIGALKNVKYLINKANGKYFIIVADDDLVDFELLNFAVNKIESNESVVALYTPWQIFDYKENKTIQLFYNAPEIIIKKNNHKELCKYIINNKIFPEIGVYKTKSIKNLLPILYEHFFFAFKYPLEYISQGSIMFANIPFHKCLHNFNLNNETFRHQEGWDARFLFNVYRNSLNHYLRILNLDGDEKAKTIQMINEFIIERMHVSYNLHIGMKEYIEAYEVGSIIIGEFGILESKYVRSKYDFKKICTFAKFDYIKRICGDNKLSKIIILSDAASKINDLERKKILDCFKIVFDFTEYVVDIEFNNIHFSGKCIYYVFSEEEFDKKTLTSFNNESIFIEDRNLSSKFI